MKKDQSFQQGSIYDKAYKNLTIINKTRTQIFALSFIFLISSQLSGQQKIVTLNTEMSGTHDVVGRDAVILSPGFHYNPSPIVGQPKNVLLTFIFDNITDALIVIDNTGYTSGIIYHPLSSKNIDEVFGGLVSQMQTELGAGWQIEYSSDYEYQAYMTIQHNSDFSFSGNYTNSSITQEYVEANENCSFTARTDRSIIVESDYLEGSGIPDPDNRPLNTSLPAGSTAGGITNTVLGGASYTIPIFSSPGTNGVQPSLSLQYNSQTGNGLLGWGWNLGGVSSISRMVKPYYVNNEIKPINMIAGDEYAIDGNRLVLQSGTGTQGTDGSKYKTEQEAFTETTAHGVSGNGPAWFEIKNLKDGSVLEYGNADHAYLQNTQNTRLTWFLTKYKDVNGNYIKYNYLQDAASGQTYLHSIQYTGNDTAGLQPYNEILIQYERRSDSFKNYQSGVEIKNELVVSKIFINCQGNTVRTYTFDYKYDLYSFLVGVKEMAVDGITYNSTIFKYNDPPEAANYLSLFVSTYKYNDYYFGDFNADGKQDAYIIPINISYPYHNKIRMIINQNGSFVQTDEIDISEAVWKIDDKVLRFSAFTGANFVDFNGDGKMDLYYAEYVDNQHFGQYPDPYPERYQKVFKSFLSTGNGFEPFTYHILPTGGELETYIGEERRSTLFDIFYQDLTGDGLADKVYVYDMADNNTEIWVYKAELVDEEIQYETYRHQYIPFEFENFIQCDYDGDGRLDLCLKTSGGIQVLDNNLNPIFTKAFPWNNLRIGDINGDGKTDFLGFGYPDMMDAVYVSFQSSFALLENFTPNHPSLDVLNKNYFLADLNGDGKDDIIEVFRCVEEVYDEELQEYHDVYSILCYAHYFNGVTFKSEQIDFTPIQDIVGAADITERNFYFTDFDGDGQAEMLYSTQLDDYRNQPCILKIKPDDKSRLLSVVMDGFNNSTKVSYGILPKSTSYSKTSGDLDYPVIKSSLPLYVVENIQSFGQGKTTSCSNLLYSYQDLILHQQGKGILGFSKVFSENSVDNVRVETEYSFVPQFYNVYPSKTKQYINNTLVSETTNTSDVNSLDDGKRYFPYISLSTIEDKIKNIKTEVSTEIDELGRLKSKTSGAKTSSGTLVSQVSESHTNFNSYGSPLDATIISTRGTESITRSVTYEYNTNGLLTKETKPSVETSYTYDGFGNILTSSVTSGSVTRTNTFTYEPGMNRFIKTKTNPIGQTITYNNDPVTGNILEEFDHTNLKTTYIYDGFGKNIEIRYPDGQKVYNSVGWSLNAVGIGELYFSKSESAHKPTTITYYDFLGRELRSKTQSFNGTYLVTDKDYDTKGRIEKSYMPYFEGSSADQYVGYSYDNIGRISSETIYPGGTTTSYTYSNLETTINKNGQIFKKEYDASGLLYKSTDPGGLITYYYNAEGKTKSIVSPSGTTTIDYDDYGYQDKLHDIDAKTIDYDYNGFGEIIKQVDEKGNQSTMGYDASGRIDHITWSGGETVSYTYNQGTGLLSGIAVPNRTQSFTYDNYYRVLTKTETMDNNTFTANYTYDSYGNMTREVLNNNVTLDYVFNGYGYLDQVKANDQLVWDAGSMNRYGQVNNYTLGNNANTVISYDQNGFVDKKETKIGSTWIQNWDYDFEASHGNLVKRKGINPAGGFLEETFTYDNLNRLLTCNVGANSYSVTYDAGGKGNISTKSGIGTYNYSLLSAHKLDSITNLTSYQTGLPYQDITYTKFNKIDTLIHTSPSLTKQLTFTYGPDEQRVKTVYTVNGNTNETRYFALGNYEKDIAADNSVRELYYISTPAGIAAIMEKTGSQTNLYYIHTDILGSFDVVTNTSGAPVERLSFDPWGRRRNPNDWTYTDVPATFLFDRGFTGHEQLDQFDLINMNGRVYDPLIAMFLSPDNFVQAPDFTQNFNRYSYCLFSPLKYTDPDGEWAWLLFSLLNGIENYQNAKDNGFSNGRALAYAGTNFLFSAVGSLLNVPGIIPNASMHAGMNVLGNGISNSLLDRSFFENWGSSAGSGFASGAYSGYQLSKEGGLNYWWGNEVGGGRNQWSFVNTPTLEYRLDEYMNNNYSQNELKLFYGDPDIKVGTNKNLENFNARNVDGNIQLKDGRTANGFITGGVQRGENITNADIRISKNTVRNLDSWGRETVGHELYHSADYRFGNYIRDIYKYGPANGVRQFEFRAYQYNYLRTGNFMYLIKAWRYATIIFP